MERRLHSWRNGLGPSKTVTDGLAGEYRGSDAEVSGKPILRGRRAFRSPETAHRQYRRLPDFMS